MANQGTDKAKTISKDSTAFQNPTRKNRKEPNATQPTISKVETNSVCNPS
jgi:hypothetical protein